MEGGRRYSIGPWMEKGRKIHDSMNGWWDELFLGNLNGKGGRYPWNPEWREDFLQKTLSGGRRYYRESWMDQGGIPWNPGWKEEDPWYHE